MTTKRSKAPDEHVESERANAYLAEEKFRLLVDSVRDYAIFLLDTAGRVASWNAGARAIKGYTAEEIVGKSVSVFYTQADREAEKPARLLSIATAEGRVEDEGFRVRKDGTLFWADVIITALRDEASVLVGFAKVTRDLTERRQVEEKLRETQEQLAATLYSIGDGVLATDQHAAVSLMNQVAERMTGWTQAEAVGKPVGVVFDIINEDTREKASNPVERVLEEGIVVGLANHTTLIARDGTERPITNSGAPIRDHLGNIRGAVLVFRDATEERRAEQERVRLAQAQEALRLRDEFMSLASHELKTPLTALQLQLEAIFGRVQSDDEKLARRMERAERAADRLAQLVESLLDVSRIATGRLSLSFEPVDLAEVVKETVERSRDAAQMANCPLTIDANRSVYGHWDKLRVEQILNNTLANAFKYASGKPVHVSLYVKDNDAVIEIRDGGPGLPPAGLGRIFDRFERGSPIHYGGLGLGLYIARQIAEAHGGTMTAGNLDEGGACFSVRLPIQSPTEATSP